jgi:uncharacterized membrane protein YdjX (TVP38/TMEM64 family)
MNPREERQGVSESPLPPVGRWRILSRLCRDRRVVIGAVLLLVVIILGRRIPIMDWLDALAGSFRTMGGWGVPAYALLYFAAAMLCLPCMPLTIAGGFIFGTTRGAIAVHTGTCAAAAAAFLLGRFAGRARIAKWLRRSERFRFIDNAIAREGWKIVALLRMHALPFGLSNYIYGMTAVPFWHYFAATALAMLPGTIIFVHLGAIGERKMSGQEGVHPLEYILFGLGFISLLAMGKLVTRLVRAYRLAAAPDR